MPVLEVGSKSAMDVNDTAIYNASFGGLPAETPYLEWKAEECGSGREKVCDITESKKFEVKSADGSGRLEVKAQLGTTTQQFQLTTQYSTSSGYLPTLFPISLDKEIMDCCRADTPLAGGLIRRVAHNSKFVSWNALTAKGAQGSLAENSTWSTAISLRGSDTYARRYAQMFYLYANGCVTGPMMAEQPAWRDNLQEEVKICTQALKEFEEESIIEGLGSASVVSGSFKGLDAWITSNVDSTNTAISIDLLRTGVRTATERTTSRGRGHPNLMVTDMKTFDAIKKLIQDQLNYPNPMYKVAWGLTAINFEGIPIIADDFCYTTGTLGGSGASERHLYILDTSVIEMKVLQDVTYKLLADVADATTFMIKEYCTLIVKEEKYCYAFKALS